jgi:TP901 family phage tail tape measure protein
MSLDTAIRLSAEVKGGGNIDRVKKSLQDLGKNSQTTAREISTLRAATFQFARANDNTIAGIRSSIGAFRGLQEQAKIGSREFQRYGAEIQKLEGKLRGLDGTAAAAGDSLGQKLATGLAAAGIGRGLQQITMQAGKFDAEVRKAAAIEGGAGSFGLLQKEIEKVAAVAAGTPTEVAALATSLSRAGFSAQETTQALAGMVRGAEATSISFEEMGSIAADNLRAFGLQTTETGRVVDVLTQTANKSNQTVLDLGESMKYAAPIARSLGVPLEDLAAVMALLANNGIRGSDAGTALRTGLTRLQIAAGGADSEISDLTRGNVQLTKAMATLGSEILDTNGKLRPLDQVLNGLRNSLSGLSATDQAILAKALFGTEAGSKFQALLNSTEGQVKTMFAAVRNSGGVAEETQRKMQGFNYSIVVAGGNVEYLANQIGGMIGAAMKPLIDTFNMAISAAMKLPDPIRNIGAAAAAAGISTLGLVVAVNAVSGALALVGGVSGAKAAIAGLTNFSAAATVARNAAVALNLAVMGPWALAAAGIAAATAAAYKFNEPFREFVNTIPARFDVFFKALQRDIQQAAARAQAIIAGTRDFVVGAFRAVESIGRQAMQNLLSTLNPVDAAFRQLGINIQSIFGSVFDSIGINWGRLISQMLERLNPMQAILKLMGVDVAGAMEQALNFRPSAAPRPAASPVVAPIPGTLPGTLPGAPPAPDLPGAAGGAGAAAGAGGRAAAVPRFELSSRGKALVAAAQKLGVSPLDLATIISFETAGTFSPSIRGGAGGNYQGLIQFGAPERRQYGVTPGQSFEEQVMGPVVRYFQDRFKGVGMSTQGASLLDLYTTVLAGNPRANRNARDSFGTSAVSGVQRMGPHRQKALSAFFGGSMENIGFGAVEQAQAQVAGYEESMAAMEQLQEQQAAAQKQLEQFNEERAKTALQLYNERSLLGATTDEQRRRLELEIEIDNITQQHFEKLQNLKAIEEEIARLGGVAETAAIREGLEREKEQQLALARLRAEQDLNEILVERQRMMQDLTRQASEPTVFNVLEQQKAQLDEILQRYPAIGQAADAAATLATNGMAEMIAGTKSAKEVFADFLQGIASALIDTAKKMIAQYIAIGIARMFAGIGAPAVGGFSGSSVGPFGAGGISPALSFPTTGFANGGIMSPSGPLPLKAYSRGGVASTPQVALFGEGSMNEAYVPLPDGRRIPVALQAPDGNRGDRMRELMGASPAGSNASPVLSMSFETTTINGVEYVSRDQLEAAMAETRKRAANDGAKRGMSMTLDRLQQSPATRSKVGIR